MQSMRCCQLVSEKSIHWLRVAVDTPSLELLQAMTNFEEILASRGLETVSAGVFQRPMMEFPP
jgi:hypothetical protein